MDRYYGSQEENKKTHWIGIITCCCLVFYGLICLSVFLVYLHFYG